MRPCFDVFKVALDIASCTSSSNDLSGFIGLISEAKGWPLLCDVIILKLYSSYACLLILIIHNSTNVLPYKYKFFAILVNM